MLGSSDDGNGGGQEAGGDQTVRPQTAEAQAHIPTPTIWLSYRHAPDWLADALREAGESGHDARRREITFAVCFADSYLAEWVIADVDLDFERSREYLPARDKRGVTDRWKDIPRQLLADGVIGAIPDLGGPHGEEWRRLVDYRDGLVHANASRPETAGLPPEWMPMPSKSELDELEPGWAVRVVVERVRLLHKAVGTDPPEWLRDL